MLYRVVGLGLWLAFLLVVPKSKWRDYYPALLFTAVLALISDLFGVVFLQWEYIGPNIGGLSLWSDLGIAPPSGALAIYFHREFPKWKIANWGFWILANAIGEWTFVQWGLIRYHQWDSIKASLFYVLFFALIYLQDRWYRWGQDELKT